MLATGRMCAAVGGVRLRSTNKGKDSCEKIGHTYLVQIKCLLKGDPIAVEIHAHDDMMNHYEEVEKSEVWLPGYGKVSVH